MGYLARLKSGEYNDSDVAAFYIDNRYRFGPFIREVGDFVAHPERDKGNTFEESVGLYAECAFFQRYIGSNRKELQAYGPCEWWLKPYLLRKIRQRSPRAFKKKLKMQKSDAERIVKSWFPGKDRFPTRIEAVNLFEFSSISQFLASTIDFRIGFKTNSVRKELKNALLKAGAGGVELDDFLVATAIILNGKTMPLAGGVSAHLELCVVDCRFVEVPRNQPSNADQRRTGFILPDGQLVISLVTTSPEFVDLVDISNSLLETHVDTEPYLDRALITHSDSGRPSFDLRGKSLQFVATHAPKVTSY